MTPKRRLDIQGLRGLAVIPGFIYHASGHLPGSMIFIDMFYAVSGYLITGRLVELAQSRGTAGYYYEFYKFRVKRLFPAAITAIAATTIVSWIVFVPSRAAHITADAVSALFFYANIHYAVQGTDYMHRSEATTPLLPFWSLSMEEQFYLVWPVLVLLLIWWGARRQRQLAALTWASALILVASFSYGFWFTHAHQVAAYYDTPSRAWDFAVGMLLAVYGLRGRLSRGPDPTGRLTGRALGAARAVRDVLNRHASVVSWAGGLLFFLAVFVTPMDYGFPVPWGAVGVLGAALVIYAGIDQRPSNWMLGNRYSAKLGDLSYSAYLVHFPIMVIAASYLSASKPALYAFDVVATAGLTALLYYFVEEPGRRGFSATAAWFKDGRHRPAVNAIAICATLATIVFAAAPKVPAVPRLQDAAQPVAPSTDTAGSTLPAPVGHDDPHAVEPTAALRRSLSRALSLTTWPAVTNRARIDNVQGALDRCAYDDPARLPCVARPAAGTDPAKVAVAVGDSTMLAYWPMLRDALVPLGWTVVMFAHSDCSAPILRVPDETITACRHYHAAFPGVVARWKPRLLLLSTSEYVYNVLADGAIGDHAASEHAKSVYTSALRSTIDFAGARGARAVVLSPPPAVLPARQPASCLVAGSSPQNCSYTPLKPWYVVNELNGEAVETTTGAVYADLVRFFCVDLRCPGAVDHVAVHADRSHITPEYSAMIAPSFAQFLEQAGLTR